MSDDPTSPDRPPGPKTLFLQAQKVADERAADQIERERQRDREQEARLDRANETALSQAEKRAEDAKAELKEKDKQVRFQWAIIALLILSVIALAGYRVAGSILGVGDVSLGGEEEIVEQP